MLFSIVACDGRNNNDIPSTSDKENNSVENPPEEDVEFYAGYARVDITPTKLPIEGAYAKLERVLNNEELYATCVALSDKNTTALVITLDLMDVGSAFVNMVNTEIKKQTGIAAENVFLSATHTHSVPSVRSDSLQLLVWKNQTARAIAEAAKTAIDDLTLTEAYIGSAESDGLAFVRRYRLTDGTYRGIGTPIEGASKAPYESHETEADPEMQVICFKRTDGKKDIVMANWQSHYGQAMADNTMTSDYIAWVRSEVEQKYDVHFAYYQGAAGNINLISNVYKINNNYIKVGKKLAEVCGEALANLEKVRLGELKVMNSDFDVELKPLDEEKAKAALDILEGRDKDGALRKKYKFEEYEPGAVYNLRNQWKENPDGTVALPVSAISCGDISFVAAPYEMFDTNGMEIKDGTPFKMSFVCAYTNGYYGYIPSSLAYSHGQYEVYISYFVEGTGEKLVEEFLRMLNEIKK